MIFLAFMASLQSLCTETGRGSMLASCLAPMSILQAPRYW